MIFCSNLTKVFRRHERSAGLKESIRSLIKRRYQELIAVNEVSFEISQGELVGFIGPNGAGKTTTLKMLSGLLHPTNGLVEVLGFTPKERKHHFLKRISLVMGNRQQLAWDLTPADSLLVNKAVYEISDANFRQRVDELIELLDLTGVINKQVRQLSLGERMKCELAAALIHEPDVLFLDEPTLGLDLNTQTAIRSFLKDYNKRKKATILLTSHYMTDITELANRVIAIDRGSIVYDGTLQGLRDTVPSQRIMVVEFLNSVKTEQIESFGEVIKHNGHYAELRVSAHNATTIAKSLLYDFELVDIRIREIPLEDVLRSTFAFKQEEKNVVTT